MYRIVILMMFASLESVAQTKVPNGNFNQFETISRNSYTYHLPVGWKEHQKNEIWRTRNGHGFAYKYDLPDASENAVALHRGSSRSYLTKENAIFSSFSTLEKSEKLRLIGRYKFSGSDISKAIDTLMVAVFSTQEQLLNIPDKLPNNATVLDLVVPKSRFEWFHLDINEIEGKYITIVIQLKSGSDDNYYWGYANAVIDDLELVAKQN